MGATVPTAFVASSGQRRRILHQALPETNDEAEEQPKSIFNTLRTNLKTAAADGFGTRARNVADTMKTNDIVVPLCSNLDKRQSLAERGVYPGVEYKICDIDDLDLASADTEQQSRSVSIRPAYPLRDYLERSDWPVSIAVEEVPLCKSLFVLIVLSLRSNTHNTIAPGYCNEKNKWRHYRKD